MSDSVPADVKVILDKVALGSNIGEYDVKLREGNQKGEGFLGDVLFIELIEKSSRKLLSLVVKRAFESEKIRDVAPIRNSFLNEIYFYGEVWPLFQKLQQEYKIERPIENISKCYLTDATPGTEYLVLENLKDLGFDTFPKTKDLSRSHLELILRTYGRIHGTSYAFKLKEPEKFQEVASNCKNIFLEILESGHFAKTLTELAKTALEKLVPGEDDDEIKKFNKYLNDTADCYRKSLLYTGNHPVLIHGDCWSNNMMFKHNLDGSPSDIRIIDWQLLQPGSPAQDLSYIIYSGASKEDLDDWQTLLKIYYKSLTDTLATYGEDANAAYPFSELEKDWKQKTSFSMFFSLMVCKIKLTEQKDMMDLKDFEDLDLNEETGSKYLKIPVAKTYDTKVRNIIRHINSIGAL